MSRIIFSLLLIFMAGAVIFIRLRAMKKPTNLKKLIFPALGMSSGFLMFLFPIMRIPWPWAISAFLIGMIFFAMPLIMTSRFYIKAGHIYLKRSRAFVYILLLLLALRLSLHSYLENIISLTQTASLFFILAFGMLLPWRVAMVWQYKKKNMNVREIN